MLRKFMKQLNDELECSWCAPDGPLGPASRRTAWVVCGGCCCPFGYGGGVVQPSPWPTCMDALMELIMPLCGLGGIENRAAWPNSCNLNRYGPTDGIYIYIYSMIRGAQTK
jgi:hypothetical protein